MGLTIYNDRLADFFFKSEKYFAGKRVTSAVLEMLHCFVRFLSYCLDHITRSENCFNIHFLSFIMSTVNGLK
jgi:hypothetical protein